MFRKIESFEESCDTEVISAMEKAMRKDITPEIMEKVLSIDPRVIKQKEEELKSNLVLFTRNDLNHNCVWEINQFFNNWTANLPDKNYGEDISRHRQGNIMLGNLDEAKSFHGTIFASIFTEKLDLGKILQLNDEENPRKSELHARLAIYTIPVIARLLALEYAFKDLIR